MSGKRGYKHSAYWYAKKRGWDSRDYNLLTDQYLDATMYYGFSERGEKLRKERGCPTFDLNFNPFVLGVFIAIDIGIAMYQTIRDVLDPVKRAEMKEELQHSLRIVRRPFYYSQETDRRRKMAIERRKIRRRRTTAAIPTVEAVLAAWNERKKSKEAMIRLGGMLEDLECYVDNSLKYDEGGNIVGRNRGIRGWIAENLPELSGKYKTLMRYKAMAKKLRQATGTKDPVPTEKILSRKPEPEIMRIIRKDFRTTFSSLLEVIEDFVKPERVFREKGRVEG